MKQPKNTSPKKAPNKNPKESDNQSYTAVGVVFLMVGLAMLLSENTRVTGIPFVTLGATFFILAQQKPSGKKK